MTRSFLVFVFSCLLSCVRNQPDRESKISAVEEILMHDVEGDTVYINVTRSSIEWIATEMRGIKKRTGKIEFTDGFVLLNKGELVGGRFIVDMHTMDITDVPAHETIARRNLLNHLKSNDFFNVAQYPTSTLEITRARLINDDTFEITANLSIREVTRSIQFKSIRDHDCYKSTLAFNRLTWNVAYHGNWADKTLIDEGVELSIRVCVQRTIAD